MPRIGKNVPPARRAEEKSARKGEGTHSALAQALDAIRQGYLGPNQGEFGKQGRLVDETSRCERSTKRAVLKADPTEKPEVFNSGFDEWRERLCASAHACYQECFELAVRNVADLDTLPAEFARSFTIDCFAKFLGAALENPDKAQRASNGRVRRFVRHACADYSDEYPKLYGGQTFSLPHWFSQRWRAKAMLAKRVQQVSDNSCPAIDLLSAAEAEEPIMAETEEFFLDKEQTLIKSFRDTIADAHRNALVTVGKAGVLRSDPAKHKSPSVRRKQTQDAARRNRLALELNNNNCLGLNYEDTAAWLGKSVKTIRNYIRDEKLKAHPNLRGLVTRESINAFGNSQ